jgi:O-antigen ligase
VGDTHLGNPILLGVPSVLMLLIVLSDKGQWMLLQQRLVLRLVIALVTAEWLIMSGSRGSWIAALSALLLLLVLSKGDRKPMAILVGLVVMVTGMALTTPLGEQIAQQYAKTMESERSMANRTSGRSAQWEALPDAFSKSPVWGWGPGVGRDVVAYYTGRHLNWHSLYLHVAVETGSIGLICLATILIALGIRTVRFWRSDGSIMPLLALTAYIMIGVSVSAFDGNCGMFLGLALIGRQSVQRYELKEVVLTARAVRS